jgi:hypothetical protein
VCENHPDRPWEGEHAQDGKVGIAKDKPLVISNQATLTRSLMAMADSKPTSEPCRFSPIRYISKPTRPQLAPESWGRFFGPLADSNSYWQA